MDLKSVELKNYMSYRTCKLTSVELRDGLHLIIGRNSENVSEDEGNGSGKTSFISAVPFALYGRVRGVFDKELNNEDYVYMDVDGNRPGKCEVTITFDQAGKLYKVYRSISKKGEQALEFTVKSGSKWNGLTLKRGLNKRTGKQENGIVRTQQRIVDVLGCDVDLFINSVYFEQSNIDTFARGTLGEKDKIIKAAIGSDRWSDYGKVVAADIKNADTEVEKFTTLLGEEGEVKDIEQGVADESAILERLDKTQKQKAKLSEKKQKELRKIELEIVRLDERNKTVVNLETQLRELEEVNEASAEIMARNDKDEAAFREELKELEETGKELKEEIEKLEANYAQGDNEYNGSTQMQLDGVNVDLEVHAADLARHEAKVENLTKEIAACEKLRKRLSELETNPATERTQEDVEALETELAATNEEIGVLTGQQKDIERKAGNVDGSECAFNSLCGFDPTDKDKETIKENLRKQWTSLNEDIERKGERKQALTGDIEQAKREVKLQEELETVKADIEAYKDVERDLKQAKAETPALVSRQEELRKQRNGIKEDLDTKQALDDIERDIKTKNTEVETTRDTWVRVDESATRIAEANEVERKAVVKRNAEIVKTAGKISKCKRENVDKLKEDLVTVKEDAGILSEDLDTLNDEIKEKQDYIKQLREREEKAKKYKKQMSELEQKLRVMKYTLDMVRKDIPHLLVANMVPELRDYAREHVYNLSNGRQDIDFRMDKDLKTKDTKAHAFDVWSMKDGRVLKYAQTSGGERGRADVGIHLAYVCFGANRSEGKMETLFLDEAGAALDKDGVERLVEIIRNIRIKYGFKKVFLISQNPDMKKLIDSKLLVTMTSEGSTIKAA